MSRNDLGSRLCLLRPSHLPVLARLRDPASELSHRVRRVLMQASSGSESSVEGSRFCEEVNARVTYRPVVVRDDLVVLVEPEQVEELLFVLFARVELAIRVDLARRGGVGTARGRVSVQFVRRPVSESDVT